MTDEEPVGQRHHAMRAADDDHEQTGFRPLLVTFGSILDPDGGLQVRSRIVAESLASLGMPPTILSTREELPLEPPPAWARAIHVPTRKPWRGFSMEWTRLIRHYARDADAVIVANAMFMPALELSGTRAPMIWDTNECQTLHYERLERTTSNRTKQLIWWALERWAAKRCRVAVAIGQAEASEWRRIHKPLQNKLMTVDHAAFVPDRHAAAGDANLVERIGGALHRPLLLFVGTIAAKHNAVAARWLIDVLAPALPDTATIVVCGPGSDQLVGGGRGGARVVLLGAVDDIDSIIATADLCLAPLATGAGVKTKVLHYLAHGKRIAGTPIAFEGLSGAPGLLESSLAGLPDLVTRIIAIPETAEAAQSRVAAQRTWLAEHHGRPLIQDQWRNVLACVNET
ncbi:MAG TPA: glycosyltransferase [Candidatus Acidoferrales bacterium]|nr:glycosyltransferase [Candidatus Acidoferrales bacterium]